MYCQCDVRVNSVQCRPNIKPIIQQTLCTTLLFSLKISKCVSCVQYTQICPKDMASYKIYASFAILTPIIPDHILVVAV